MSGKSEEKPNSSWFLFSNQKDDTSTNPNGPESDLEMNERLANIFKQLDKNGNGRIDIQELTAALKGCGMSAQYAEVNVVSITDIMIFENIASKLLKMIAYLSFFHRNF